MLILQQAKLMQNKKSADTHFSFIFNFPIILIEEIKDLSERILNYNGGMEGKEFHSHNVDFVEKFKSIVDTMFVT